MNAYFPPIDPLKLEAAWKAADTLAKSCRGSSPLSPRPSEPDGEAPLTIDAAGLRVDFARQQIPPHAQSALHALAEAAALANWRDAMLRGETVNASEGRAALHTALRDPNGELTDDLPESVRHTVRQTLARMRTISDQVRSGVWRGASGRPISDVFHLGIGGSQLGPELACDALHRFSHPRLRNHFLGNIDPDRWHRVSRDLNPHTTLIIIASKSWRTPETARNAQAARQWLLDAGIAEGLLGRHLVAVSSNLEAAQSLGVLPENILACPDWVGGRYSLWGAVGLPIMMQVGPEAFDAMLAGARSMDSHFARAPVSGNAPMQLALTSAWNAARLGSGTEAVIPYSDALRRLPAHLQQLQMESNGKSVNARGEPLSRATMPVVWGEPGTDSQHSFFQALHQGVAIHPIDLIMVGGVSDTDPWLRSRVLNANAVAQAQALSNGYEHADPQRRHPGGRPVTIIHLPQLNPATLGALIALYEHKTVCLGWLWGVNPFDQWGVELGKRLAVNVEALMTASTDQVAPPEAVAELTLDPATESTLRYLKSL